MPLDTDALAEFDTDPSTHAALRPAALRLKVGQQQAYLRVRDTDSLLPAALWAGELAVPSQELVEQYVQRRVAGGADVQTIISDVEVLNRVWEAGHRAGLWKGCPPPVPLTALRLKHTISESVAEVLGKHPIIFGTITRPDVLAYTGFTEKERAGLVLTCLAFESGIVTPSALRSSAFALHEPVLATGDFHYLELGSRSPISGRLMTQRYLLGPLSAVLCLRDRQAVTAALSNSKGTLPSYGKAWSAIRSFLKHPIVKLEGLAGSLTMLCEIAQAHYAISVPQFLCAYMKGSLASSSLPDNRFRQVIGYEPRSAERLNWEQALEGEGLLGISAVDIEADAALLLHAIVDSTSAAQAATELEEIVTGSSAILPATCLLAAWALSELRANVIPGLNRRHTRMRQVLSDIALVILSVCPKLDIEFLTQESAKDLVWQLNHRVKGDPRRSRLGRQFLGWLNYLLAEAGEEPINAEGRRMPSANLMTYAEVRVALDILLSIECGSMNPVLRRAARAHLCGILLGLRSAEWMGLRSRDAHPLLEPTLSVRAYKGKRVKTSASPRDVPVELLPPDIAQILIGFMRDAWVAGSPKWEMLSADVTGAPIRKHQLAVLIAEAIKAATDDPTFVKHHGRHSFGNHMLLACMTDRIDLREIRKSLGDLGEAIDDAKRIRDLALGPLSGIRDALTGVSCLLGHSTAATTCEHYVHVLDICLYAALRQSTHIRDLSLLKKASHLSRSTTREGRVETINDLLRMMERAHPENVLREDTPRRAHSKSDGLLLAKELERRFNELRAHCDAPDLQGYDPAILEHSRLLASLKSARKDAAVAPHEMTAGKIAGRFYPADPPNSEAARGAIRACEKLSRLSAARHPDLDWALRAFATGLQSKEGRVGFQCFEDLTRFSALLLVGGQRPEAIFYGKGNVRRQGWPVQGRYSRAHGRCWISIGTVPEREPGARRDYSGARWAWQMAFLLGMGSFDPASELQEVPIHLVPARPEAG